MGIEVLEVKDGKYKLLVFSLTYPIQKEGLVNIEEADKEMKELNLIKVNCATGERLDEKSSK